MSLWDALPAQACVFSGPGVNHEGERFVGRLELQPLLNKGAYLIHYTATRDDGVHLHQEATLLGRNETGALCLWPVMEELPFILPHVEIGATSSRSGEFVAIFSSGPREQTASFREEIRLEVWPDGRWVYAHAWGMPGESCEQRSSCALFPQAS